MAFYTNVKKIVSGVKNAAANYTSSPKTSTASKKRKVSSTPESRAIATNYAVNKIGTGKGNVRQETPSSPYIVRDVPKATTPVATTTKTTPTPTTSPYGTSYSSSLTTAAAAITLSTVVVPPKAKPST